MICPTSDLQPIVQLNNIEYGHDLKLLTRGYKGMAGRELSDVFNAVLEPQQYQKFLELVFAVNKHSGYGEDSEHGKIFPSPPSATYI